MPTTSSKLRVTQTLISSWEYGLKADDGYEDFLRTLRREPKPVTKAMLDGQRFENVLNNVLKGEPIPEDHEWYGVIMQMAEELYGAQQQVTIFKEIPVDGETVLLHGVLDYLKAGKIYDCKFSKKYHFNKYLGSPQHPMYLRLVPEASQFVYIISDGAYVFREQYDRDDITPIDYTIHHFFEFLKVQNLWETFVENWTTNS